MPLKKAPKIIKPDVKAKVQFQTYQPHEGSTFHQPETFYLSKAQVYDVDHLFKLYEGLYKDYPDQKPFVLLVNPRFCEKDYTERQKKGRGFKCIRLSDYMQRRGIEIPPEFFEKYVK